MTPTISARTESAVLSATTAAARFLSRVVGWAVGVLDIALPTAWRPAPRTAPDAEHAAFVAESAASLAAFTAALTTIRNRVPLHVVDAPARVSLPCVTIRPAPTRLSLPVVTAPRSVALNIVAVPAPVVAPAPKRTRRTARSRNANPVMASAAPVTAPATVAELRKQATARGHKGVSRLAKAALITLLAAADSAPAPAAEPVAPAPVVATAADTPAELPKPLTWRQLAAKARNADTTGRYAALARQGGILSDGRYLSVLSDAERVKAGTALGYATPPRVDRFAAHASDIMTDAAKRSAPA